MGRLEIRVIAVRNIGKIERHGKPDPYVKIKHGDKKEGTKVSYRTRTLQNIETFGTYDEIFKFQINDSDKDQLRFELMNENVVIDDVIGTYTLSLNGLTRGIVKNYWAILQGTRVSSAEIELDILAVDFGADPTPGAKTFVCIEDTKKGKPITSTEAIAATTTPFASTNAVQTPYPQAPQGLPQKVTYGAPPPPQQLMPGYNLNPQPPMPQPQYYRAPQPLPPQPQQQYYAPPPPQQQQQYYLPPQQQQQFFPPPQQPMQQPNFQPAYAPPQQQQQRPPAGMQYAYGVPPDM